jgi:hypothetical protein
MKYSAAAWIILGAVGLASLGCEAADKIENKITCSSVCNRYKDCFDSDYNVDSCVDSCESEANASEDKDRKLEQCDACIDGQSCTAAAFGCATECGGIIIQ